MQSYVREGKSITVAAPRTLLSDAGVQIGNVFGIAAAGAASGGSVEIETAGVFDLAKDASTFANGDPVYWDNVAFLATSVVGGVGFNLHIGNAVLNQPSGTNAAGALTGDTTVRVRLNGSTATSNLRMAHAQYSFAVDGGAISAITPVTNATIPLNAVIVGSVVNSTTAVTSLGSATMTVGTTAGSSATSILGSTAKATLSANALIAGAAQFATPVKMSAAGQITVTVGTAALTAGIVEVYVFYYASAT